MSHKYLVTVHSEPPHEPVTYTFVAPDEETARAMARERAREEHRAWRSMDSREIGRPDHRGVIMCQRPGCGAQVGRNGARQLACESGHLQLTAA